MNINEMQSLWNSPENGLEKGAQQEAIGKFTRQMIRRRRFQAVWLVNTFTWLTLITAMAGWNIAKGKVAVEQEWALIPLLTVPWAFAFHFLRRYLRPAAPIARGEMSVADSLRAALGMNRAERSHLKSVGLLFAIVIPIVAVSMGQLRAVEKVSPREFTSMAIFFGGVLLISGTVLTARYFGRLLPQERKLNALLGEMNEG